MNDLLPRLRQAKTNNSELNQLIRDYMPFIKKEVVRTPVFQMDFDDRLSIAMLIFMNCVRQYDESMGGFLPFVATCIRNRMIDEGKKLSRYHQKVIPLNDKDDSSTADFIEATASTFTYEREQERLSLSEEIDLLSLAMADFDITFDQLSDICPKQKRSRNQCASFAQAIVADATLKEGFLRTQRIPQAELSKRFKCSEKTVEKHRRYIVTITLILLGDYPGIQAFLPKGDPEK